MSIRMQRDINELKERVEKLEAVVASLIVQLNKSKPGRPKKNGTLSAETNH